MNNGEDIRDRKETSSISAATAENGNIKEELTSVTKPETTAISKEIMVITPPLIKYSNVVIVRPSFQEKRGEDDSISDKAKDASKSFKQTVSVVGEKAKLGNNNNIKKDKIVNKIDYSYKQLDKEDSIRQNSATIPVNEERFPISKIPLLKM